MGRPRKNPLPDGVYERKYASGQRAYWISFVDAASKRRRERGGTSVAEAVALLAARQRDVATGVAPRSNPTLAEYAVVWVELRRRDGVRTVDREEAMLRDHVLPSLGRHHLAEIRPTDVASVVRGLRSRLAPKSVRNVHGVMSALFARARFDELIVDNPAKGLPRGIVPRNVRVRDVGAWTREEVEKLISRDERVPEDRTVAYAIAAFTGARLGEIAGLRWRDLDTKARPLWRWALSTQYDGQKLKTENPRHVPIHGQLQAILEQWKADGWPRLMCRQPSPTDFVLPRPRERASVRPQHLDVPHHTPSSLGARAVQRHATKLGIAPAGRDFHSFRRSFITNARTDGANVALVERVTHNASGTMLDRYSYFEWRELCAAVSCLKLRAFGHASGHTPGKEGENQSDFTTFSMEPRGIEHAAKAGFSSPSADIRDEAPRAVTLHEAENPGESTNVSVAVTRVTNWANVVDALRQAGRDDLAAWVEERLARPLA